MEAIRGYGMKTLTNVIKAPTVGVGCWTLAARFLLALTICLGWAAFPAAAQNGGDAAINGVVTDSTGAVVPNADVSAINIATGVETKRTSSSAGVYQVSPLIVGTYKLKVSAPGFQVIVQEGIELHENMVFGLNPVLQVGNQQETVTVSEAPPSLDTANAVLGSTIQSQEFMELPILLSGQQRDVTSFSNLLPGAQSGSRSTLFSGTANRVQEVYLDGIPMTTISQIGDNRPILNAVPSEGIGEIGALTSGQSAEYQGAGSVNYSMKTGGNKLHGSVVDFVRNTIFDTWGFTAAYATQAKLVNGVVTTVPVGKPVDHQNEFSITVGGPVVIPHLFNGHDKLFFFGAYDKTHIRNAPSYAATSVPTLLMRQSDFSELLKANGGPGYTIYDPTSQAACTANSTTGPCRYAYGQSAGTGMGANGNPTGTITNVIPQGQLSPIAQTMQSFLPAPSSSGIQNNYIGGTPSGYDNWLYSGRFDYTISPKQTISGTITGGNRKAVPYTSSSNMIIPAPYTPTTYSEVAGHWADLSDSYTITPNVVNQFKFGFSNFGGPPLRNITQGVKAWEAQNMGITFTGVPANGQAVTEFPTSNFAGSNAPFQWGAGSSGVTATTVSESYTGVDNLLWIKGKHAMTFGMQMQWLQMNADTYDGPTSNLQLNWSTNETAAVSGSSYGTGTGYSYASYMLGAVGSTGITLQPFSTLGGRYNTISPYFQDDYKISPKLTINLGLSWDDNPPYREVHNRFSFLNPNIANPVTGNNGALQFAGNWGGSSVSCNCTTPIKTYWKNWGPRVGFAYSLTPKTTIRAAYSLVYSHGGGTGGAGNTYNGPSQLGFTSSPSYTDGAAGASAGPAFYLNNSTGFASMGLSNNNFGGPGYTVPAITAPGAVSQTLNVGNTVSSAGAFVTASAAPGYADPYLSGRSPEFSFWNFGIQRELASNLVLTVNYTGSESHFITGAGSSANGYMRGKYSGQIDPIYYALGTTLNLPATSTNLAAANTKAAAAGLPAITLPYTSYGAAAATSTGAGKATIGQALTWMPQFSGTTDTWGSQSANASYHSLQASLQHKLAHGLTLNVNYTYSKNLDDAGTMRSGYAIPASVSLNGKGSVANRADRSISANSIPNILTGYGTYKSPFGKNGIGANNFFVRQLAGGWSLSTVFSYDDGTPQLVVASSCTSTYQPTAGTCMPDLNPSYTSKSVRQNGSWGKGINARTLGKAPTAGGISYAKGYVGNNTEAPQGTALAACTATSGPFCNPGQFMIGDAPRSAAYGLRNPSTYNINMGLRRTFDITKESVKFVFAADCTNATNHVTFSGINVGVDNNTFGTVSAATGSSGSRDFQFSGRLNF
jgi:hypothetical protein